MLDNAMLNKIKKYIKNKIDNYLKFGGNGYWKFQNDLEYSGWKLYSIEVPPTSQRLLYIATDKETLFGQYLGDGTKNSKGNYQFYFYDGRGNKIDNVIYWKEAGFDDYAKII